MLFPITPDAAQAEEATESSPRATTSVSLTVPAAIEFADVMATPSGATTTASATIGVTTTASAGYKLYLYAEDNSLKSLNPNTVQSITSASASSLDKFANNTWGYNLTEGPTAGTTYSAIPTTNTTPTQTKDTSDSNSANDTYTLSLGAKVDSTIPSGTYTSILTVAVVAEPRAITYIQDLTLADCQSRAYDADFTVTDRRDDNGYTVRYINGACWMTQNLRLSSTTESGSARVLTSADSNVTRNWSFPNNSLDKDGTNYIDNSYTEAGFVISDDPQHAAEYGGYYNYCAASAGTVCNDATTEQDATQDICPRGWRLPTLYEMSGVTSYVSAFSPVYSGAYVHGSLISTGSSGFWWSATADSRAYQHYLFYSSGSLNTNSSPKSFGFSVRCIRSNLGTLTINFDGNGSTGGSTASQQIIAGNTASLNANGFTRTGYVFTGWNTAANGSGTSYADGADYTVAPATGNATITLYAQWKELVNLLDDVTYMQDLTAAQCSGSSDGVTATLIDRRDNNSYTIAKISDTCWMTQNLRLSGGRTLTSADSNVTQDWNFPTTQLDGNSDFSYTEPQTTISSNTSYGGYYNYCAASAGTVCNNTTAQDATQDICPKGWRLPTYNEQSGITGIGYVSAFSPVLSGSYQYGTLYNAGFYGRWWSATADSNSSGFQYHLEGNRGSLTLISGLPNYFGLSVRCIRSS